MNRPPKLQDDGRSECRSFGSNYKPCSQSRKMSIGITVNSFPKSKGESNKENEAAVLVSENGEPTRGSFMVNGDNRKVNVDIRTDDEKIHGNLGKKNIPVVPYKSVYNKLPISEGNLDMPVRSELHGKCIVENETYSVQSFANRILESKCNEQKEKMYCIGSFSSSQLKISPQAMNRPPKLQDDGMSGGRSFSNKPCSQSRKMSIGITINSFDKSKFESIKENEAAVLVSENGEATRGNSMVSGDNRKVNLDIRTDMEKIHGSLGKKNIHVVPSKSVYNKLPISEGKCIGEKETSATCSVQSFGNQVLDSKCNEQKEKMFGKVISEEKKRKDGTVQEQVSDKVAVDMPHENSRGCETLKLKLWEILGTVSSPNKEFSDAQDLNVASKSLHSELKDDTHGNAEGAAKQNSDTIESDTQKPTETVRRPVTRSLARKKALPRQKTITRRNSSTTCYKDHLEKDIFSFKDGWPGGLSDALNDGLPTSKRKKATRHSYGTEKSECLVPKENNAHTSKRLQNRGKSLSSTEKSSSRGNAIPFEPRNLDKDFSQTEPRRIKEVTKDIGSPNLQKSEGQPEGLVHSYLKNKVLSDVTRSPSIEVNSPVRRSTLAPPTFHEVQDLDEHGSRERITNSKDMRGFKETYSSTRSPSTEMNTPVRRSFLASPTIRKVQDVDEHRPGENTPVRRSSLASPTICKVQDVDELSSGEDTPVRRSFWASPTIRKVQDVDEHRPGENTPVRRSSLASPTIRKVQDVDELSSGEDTPLRRSFWASPTIRKVQDVDEHRPGENTPVRRSSLASPTIRKVQDVDEHSSEENTPVRRSSLASPTIHKVQDVDELSSGENTPVRRCSLASATIRKVLDVDEHWSGERIYNTKGMQSLKRTLDSSDEEDEDSEYCPIGSSSEEDSERSEDILHKRDYQHTLTVSPENRTAEKTNLVSPFPNMFSNQKSIRTDKRSASVSSKEEARRKLLRHLEKNQDDGLTSAIALFALALERLRGKVKSISQKKSAEILNSVAEEISLQLQNAETQIQADMEKVAEHGRSKRKRLETRFLNLEGQLASIYERFKKEVNQQAQDYRDTLEGSEALKLELRGSMEKQRALHRKLLSQAEEAIGNKLSDAQRRIDTVHNLGRGKMVQLKNILAEVLGDGVLG